MFSPNASRLRCRPAWNLALRRRSVSRGLALFSITCWISPSDPTGGAMAAKTRRCCQNRSGPWAIELRGVFHSYQAKTRDLYHHRQSESRFGAGSPSAFIQQRRQLLHSISTKATMADVTTARAAEIRRCGKVPRLSGRPCAAAPAGTLLRRSARKVARGDNTLRPPGDQQRTRCSPDQSHHEPEYPGGAFSPANDSTFPMAAH
jgi:hypothetical protein